MGGNGPRWYARDGIAQEDHYGFKREAWFPAVMAEVKAVRENAGLIDISAFSKIEVSGPDAAGVDGSPDPQPCAEGGPYWPDPHAGRRRTD